MPIAREADAGTRGDLGRRGNRHWLDLCGCSAGNLLGGPEEAGEGLAEVCREAVRLLHEHGAGYSVERDAQIWQFGLLQWLADRWGFDHVVRSSWKTVSASCFSKKFAQAGRRGGCRRAGTTLGASSRALKKPL